MLCCAVLCYCHSMIHNPHTNQWSLIQPMNHHRSDASACSVSGKIVIVGGFNGNECLNTTELYDPEVREWRDLPRMGSRRSGVGSVSFRENVYAVGMFLNPMSCTII